MLTAIVPVFLCFSVVSYWEGFSTHAFENTTQNFFQSISLALNTGGVNPCTCCFTIRRDVSLLPVNPQPRFLCAATDVISLLVQVFDLPSVVIGQFLPIPAETQ